MRSLAVALFLCLSIVVAHAGPRSSLRCVPNNDARMTCGQAVGRLLSHPRASSQGRIVAHPKGCPRVAFCGCGVSVWAFGHSIRSLWLARSYFKFPRSIAGKGRVAIFRHGRHVAGIIEAYGDGTALLYDPNSGHHLTRIHRRSIKRAVIVDPHAERVAGL